MNNKSILLLALLVAIGAAIVTVKVTALPNAGTGTVKNESAYDRVIRTKTLRCGYGISPPNLVKDTNTGQLSGADYEIWQAIGKELDIKIVWAEEAGWGNFIEGLRSNRYDAFCSQLWPDPARTRFLTMAGPVVYSPLFAYVRSDDSRYDGAFEKINNSETTIPGIDGDIGATFVLSHFPNAKLLTLPQTATLSDMLLSVVTKKADLLFLNNAMFLDFDKNNPGKLRQVKDVDPAFMFASYYGFNVGETALKDMVSVPLRAMLDNGAIEAIARNYDPSAIAAKKNY